MSAGRKIIITLTQAEAQVAINALEYKREQCTLLPDVLATNRSAQSKLQHQLDAVRGNLK